MDGCGRGGEGGLEARAPLGLRHAAKVLVAEGKQVPRDEAGRRLCGQHLHARCGWVDPEEERLERKLAVGRDHDLPVDDAALRERGAERLGELREVAVERLEVATLDQDLVAVAEDDRPEAVPFRFVQPAVADGQVVARLREHRLERRVEGQAHRRSLGSGPRERN